MVKRRIKKLIFLMLPIIMIITHGSIVYSYAAETNENKKVNIVEEAQNIYYNMLIEAGFINENDTILLSDNITYSHNEGTRENKEIISFIEEDNELKDAYTVIKKAVATEQQVSLSNSDIVGFTITVTYDYYYPGHNDWKNPYYRHGSVVIRIPNVQSEILEDFKCAYISRGLETSEEGYTTGDFVTATTYIYRNKILFGQSISAPTSNIGNPYIAKFGSTFTEGKAFSIVLYQFSYEGVTYENYREILHDESEDLPGLNDFIWDDSGPSYMG